jgi:hypothetical protein
MRLQACIVDYDAVTNKSVQSVLVLPEGPPLEFLLGVLNINSFLGIFCRSPMLLTATTFPRSGSKRLANFLFAGRRQRPVAGRKSSHPNLAAKAADPSADVSAWEREIDEIVYRLYGLTEEEIKIVEGAQK